MLTSNPLLCRQCQFKMNPVEISSLPCHRLVKILNSEDEQIHDLINRYLNSFSYGLYYDSFTS